MGSLTFQESLLVKKLSHGETKLKDNVMVFYEEDKQILRGYNNKSLYVIAFVHDVKLMVDLDLLNIMHYKYSSWWGPLKIERS